MPAANSASKSLTLRPSPAATLVGLPAAVILSVSVALPLLWLLAQLLLNPAVHADLFPTSFRLQLLGRTLLYNGTAGVLATLLALPAALVLGRGRGWTARAMWVLLPCALLMPSLAYAYGWQQFLRTLRPALEPLGITLAPGGTADILRCIGILAAWLWPIPACLIGLSLRRLDPALQQHAALDGAALRITLSQLRGTCLASAAIVTLLATQEFSVYEPTGISVVATEMRMVFETGAFSSLSNSIAGGGAGSLPPDQAQRAAAAIACALPMLLVTVLLSGVAFWGLTSDAGEVASGDWPAILDAPRRWRLLAAMIFLLTAEVPVAWLCFSLRASVSPREAIVQFAPQLGGSLLVAGITALLILALAASASAKWLPGALGAALLLFLLGGQLLAIALIQLFNRPATGWLYDSAALPVIAYLGRFGWIALATARLSWSSPWRDLRDLARVDGATRLQAARWVILPLALPSLLAAALLVAALSLCEVPATVLLSPQNPQVLTTTLMGWVHIARYDPLIEACLLLITMTLLLGLAAAGLLLLARRRAATKIKA